MFHYLGMCSYSALWQVYTYPHLHKCSPAGQVQSAGLLVERYIQVSLWAMLTTYHRLQEVSTSATPAVVLIQDKAVQELWAQSPWRLEQQIPSKKSRMFASRHDVISQRLESRLTLNVLSRRNVDKVWTEWPDNCRVSRCCRVGGWYVSSCTLRAIEVGNTDSAACSS